MSDAIKAMVDKFLGWRLPMDFGPDGGISFAKTYNAYVNGVWVKDAPRREQDWPIGTNLLTADQARVMFEYCAGEVVQENTRLHAEVEALRKDAERYRWLRSPFVRVSEIVSYDDRLLKGHTILDDAIDAAIKEVK